MVQREGEDLHHLPVATRALQQVLLQAPERLGQFGEGGAIAQGAWLALKDGQIMPPVVDGPGRQLGRLANGAKGPWPRWGRISPEHGTL